VYDVSSFSSGKLTRVVWLDSGVQTEELRYSDAWLGEHEVSYSMQITSSSFRIPIEANPRDVLSQARNVRSTP